MKSNSKKQFTTVALIWVACFILFSFIYMLVLAPQAKAKEDVARQLAQEKLAYDSALKAAEEETQARLRQEVEDKRNRLREFVVDFGESANLTFDISRSANEHNMGSFSIRSADSSGVSELPGCNYLGEHRFGVSFKAGFNEFATFVNVLERHEPTIFVDKFDIARSNDLESGHPVKLSLAVLTKKQEDN